MYIRVVLKWIKNTHTYSENSYSPLFHYTSSHLAQKQYIILKNESFFLFKQKNPSTLKECACHILADQSAHWRKCRIQFSKIKTNSRLRNLIQERHLHTHTFWANQSKLQKGFFFPFWKPLNYQYIPTWAENQPTNPNVLLVNDKVLRKSTTQFV